MKQIFRKVVGLFIIITILFCSSCVVGVLPNSTGGTSFDDSSVSEESDSSSSEDSSIVEENIFAYPEKTVLKENIDYIDYSALSSEGKIENYSSKWLYNELSVPLADPYVYAENGVYYIYGTTDRTIGSTIDCYTTRDFKEYTHHPDVYEPRYGSWEKVGENNALIFAPELIKYDGAYYLSYSNWAQNDGVRYISMAKSSSPTGPFLPIKEYNSQGAYINGYSAPLFNNNPTGIDVLDQHYFFDGDDIYVYYSVYHDGDCEYIVGVKMIDILTPDWSTYKILIRPGQISPEDTSAPLTWETYVSWFPVVEAPAMIKSPNGKYYLTYSVNHYPYRYYSVCYAYSDSPLGDYVKPYTPGEEWSNLLFGYAGPKEGDVYEDWKGFMSGCAHHCFFKVGEQWMIGYHGHKNRGLDTSTSWVARAFAVDYMYFDEQGVPYGEGPTYSLQFSPESISGYKNIAPLASLQTENIEYPTNLNDGYIVSHHHLFQKYYLKESVLGKGYSYVVLDFGKEYHIGGISIYNSSKYENIVKQVEYINFLNDNVIFKPKFPLAYYDVTKAFVNPASAINIELKDIVASKAVICFRLGSAAQINEIRVYGKEITN